MSQYKNSDMKGDNAGCGNRAVAAHVADLHAAAKMSGSVSSRTKPSRGHAAPGADSYAKSPRRSNNKSSGMMD